MKNYWGKRGAEKGSEWKMKSGKGKTNKRRGTGVIVKIMSLITKRMYEER